MDNKQKLKEFERQFGHFKKLGLEIHGIANLSAGLDVIDISTPFIFDHRIIPKNYLGLDVRSSIKENTLPKDFQNIDSNEEYLWAYQRFELFIDNNTDLIRKTLSNPNMGREEILDAICFGNFKNHKEMCLDLERNGKIPKWVK